MGQHGAGKGKGNPAKSFSSLPDKQPINGSLPECNLYALPSSPRGEEVTDEVIDGKQSVVVTQAANRMHVQKGLLAWLLGHR